MFVAPADEKLKKSFLESQFFENDLAKIFKFLATLIPI